MNNESETTRTVFDRISADLTSRTIAKNRQQEEWLGIWKQCKILIPNLILAENMLRKCRWKYTAPERVGGRPHLSPESDPNQLPHLELFSALAAVLNPGEKPVDPYGHYQYAPWPENIRLYFDDGWLSIHFQDEVDAFEFIIKHGLEVELGEIQDQIRLLEANLAAARNTLLSFEQKTHIETA